MPGAPGYTLDVKASVPVIAAALTNGDNRVARLVLQETPAPPPSLSDLKEALNSYLLNFPGFAAVYVRDLQSGEDANVDADVSFSGMSTLKIGIVAAVMQQLHGGIQADDLVSYEIGQWMDYALGESNNYAANLLVRYLGNGNINVGARQFTAFMGSLGFVNTYMQSGYDAEIPLAQIPTPGNQRTDWRTNPDANLQSTPAEMGRILSAIYECTQSKGLLITNYPDEITPDECLSILFYMSHDEFRELIWAGLPRPEKAWIVHKHGFAFESHSDVALIWGPAGPYVLSIFLYRRGWMDWATSNSAMKTLSRITWNFFQFQKEQTGREPPPPLVLTPPPGYAKLKEYIPAAAAPER
jgi:beta-lactamase class A